MNPARLPDDWRARAAELERYAPPAAAAFRTAAEELDEALREAEEELLPPLAAATDCGYSRRRLRELVADGKLINYGDPGRPLYRRSELPRRARRDSGTWDPDEHVRAVVGGAP